MAAVGQVFVPFRSLGVVVNNVPFHLFSVKEHQFLALPIGKSYQVLGCENLRLSRIGPLQTRKVVAISSYERYILTTQGADIIVSSQTDVIKVLKGHKGTVRKLLVIGVFLVSIADDSKIIIWDLQRMREQGEITLPSDFRPTCIMHPDTYLNKVLIGDENGQMALYNLRSKKLVYQFPSFGAQITCIAQSPVVDVVGIGLVDGRIVIHNLKLDKTITTFTQTEGAVTTLAFRTDKQALLCSGTPHGQIALWDLTKRRLLNMFKAHSHGPVVQATFLHNEPVLVTAGSDNAVKMWVFDMGDQDTGRLLRARLGHPEPPKVVRWFGTNLVITAGGHCIRSQKVMSDGGTREFGVATQIKKLKLRSSKLPPLIDFAFNPLKHNDWDDIITCHENSTVAHTWSTARVCLGAHALVPTEPNTTPIKAVAISACGNYAFTGTASGWVDKFNLQSGLHRAASAASDTHTAAIVGMCCDASNRYLISGSLDGFVKLWNTKLELEHIIDFGSPINKMALSPHSQLLAVACDDLIVRLYDIDAKRTVRKFVGHSNLITDIAFSADERWVVTASTDTTVRVWDIPTGKMIDWFAPKKTVTSLSFSAAGDFLATTHAGERSVSVWSNKAYFSGLMLHAAPAIAPSVALPTVQRSIKTKEEDEEEEIKVEEEVEEIKEEEGEGKKTKGKKGDQEGDMKIKGEEGEGDVEVKEEDVDDSIVAKRKRSEDDDGEEEEIKTEEEDVEKKGAEQLDPMFITTSTVSKSKWISLADLDRIKERNKMPTKATVPDLPFFIPTVSSLEPTFDKSAAANGNKDTKSRIISLDNSKPQTKWMLLLADKKYSEAMLLLASLSPSGIDFELHSVPLTDDYFWFVRVLKFFRHELKTNYRFELVQAYMNRFLKIHNDVLTKREVSVPLEKLLQTQQASWQRIESIFHSNLCLVNYFSNLRIM
eukprot:Phypoly_transcript_00231.p1 GENE.Phypoly_transcript_00231~~Phypoly_transcript_00231.p1  ORF type:complete len:947 (+),score=145.37 Phypoly_transcript_00231:28-2841(+)